MEERDRVIKKIVGGIILLVIAVGIIGAIAGGDDKSDSPSVPEGQEAAAPETPAPTLGPKVKGSVKKSL
jgi:hypothetical protein